jgi:DNA mismatch endonuclease (patch repair protein)
MAAIKSKGMKPELLVRRLLHSLGYRFRLHRRDLPGCPDIVFPSRRKAIFVHGCFWHQHGCKLSHVPKSRLDYWTPKLKRNVERHSKNITALRGEGWDVLTVWECKLKDGEDLDRSLTSFLGAPGIASLPPEEEAHGRRRGRR